ncbi:TasA family protein [Salibacterium qingdaonense]|uniref:SipW-cognate class signal peptide n=1 Tax=Salibacterium qingdaonense TaxID=266892 RepID=A0A1I4LB10_9BACI|nr:TasA family protein [Salibacterium qingdaonense]SFL88111.1 SipW-cognate class signal peptide [Salibacterium qingdaonense]
MRVNKRLRLGIFTAALGLFLISGGTFAFFNDTSAAGESFSSGTLNLSANPVTSVDLDNIKPGDSFTRSYTLKNDGSLNIADVLMTTEYTVVDAKNDNGTEDFGDHIEVSISWENEDGYISVQEKKLSEATAMEPNILGDNILEAGKEDEVYVTFEFLDNGKDQNIFQGDAMEIEWTFEGKQEEGEEK